MRIFSQNIFSPSGAGRSTHSAGTVPAHRGSALLIVLGFLSFMMISGVSFAIYMRIERQASSNYRHSTTARHMLNAGLYRAIDEIDSELRIKTDARVRAFNSIAADSGVIQVKFPKWKDWPGRVKVSACDNEDQNNADACVLSFESLSFLPAFLINDVRRFAVSNDSDPGYDEDDPTQNWMGAKWRTLTRATDGVAVGRYAYVCVNVSDMLNVNLCRAQYRDSYTNRVTVGHLFDNDTERREFDADAAEDIQYLSMQDFYVSRYAHDKNKTEKGKKGSPYHFVLNGSSSSFSVFGNTNNLDHLFCTDSIIRPNPVFGDACNLTLKPPISAADLSVAQTATDITVNDTFKKAMRGTFSGLDNNYFTKVMPFLIADYIDTDSIPKRLNVPSVEMVPMISQIVIEKDAWAPKIITTTKTIGDPAREVTAYSVQMFGERVANTISEVNAPIYVEVVWPFKYHQYRINKPSYTVELKAYVQLHVNHTLKNTMSFKVRNECIPLTQGLAMTVNKTDTWTKTITGPGDCFSSVPGLLKVDKASNVTKKIIDSEGTLYNGFAKDQKFSVSLIVFARIKCGSYYVDSAPQLIPYPLAGGVTEDTEFSNTPKLFFQTESTTVADVMPDQLKYLWSGLEVADPRFNYRASNWTSDTKATKDDCGRINPTTTALLGKDGRDADIFMSVSDAGYLQSPGELGFIIRPFPYTADTTNNLDFKGPPADEDYMFRTIRLYDHGGPDYAQDDVYSHFYMMNRDGTLPGARVNPLSDIPKVLEGAIFNTPLDYWLSSTNNGLAVGTRKDYTFNKDSRHFNGDVSRWEPFRDAWSAALIRAVTNSVKLGSRTAHVNREYKSCLSDVYGKWDVFKWYSDDTARTAIFDSLTLLAPMHEIDRKMLYSFSLDSFSDRQQLFLFFLRAEATVQSFGSSGAQRSLAGGRAVALVWRDPYPRGYDKEGDIKDIKGLNAGIEDQPSSEFADDLNTIVTGQKDYQALKDKREDRKAAKK